LHYPPRSQSMLPSKTSLKDEQADQLNQSYLQNPLYIKNMEMWTQIIDTVSQ